MDNEMQIQETELDNLLDDDVEIEGKDIIKEELNDEAIAVNRGSALNFDEAYKLIASCDTKIIYLIGPANSGKTTIETTLYQLFHDRSIEDYYFAGSETLNAYEERAFTTRINSNNEYAQTTRTPLNSSDIFLHLRVWNSKNGKIRDLLFADISGEEYRGVVGSVTKIREQLGHIRCADYIVSIIDGEEIIDTKLRLGAIEETKNLIRTVYDAGLFKVQTRFQVVFSKYDLILNDEKNNSKNFVEKQKNILESFFAGSIGRVEVFKVAAMPTQTESGCEIGYGINDLFLSWNVNSVFSKNKCKVLVNSEFNRLRYKLLGDSNE